MGQSIPPRQETSITSTTMVQLQFPPPDTEKEARTPILRIKNVPHILPVTIRETRKQREEEKVMSLFSFLGTCLLFIGFLMVLFSIKSVWDLKIENWRLVKENAALKKTVRDNVSVEKFKQRVPSEDEIMEFERPTKIEDPDLSWSVSVQIFWSSPFITPCNMNWLARELADQIYDRKKEIDQEVENMKFEEEQVEEMFKKESKNSPIIEEVFEVATGGPYNKFQEYSEFESKIIDLEEELLENEIDDVQVDAEPKSTMTMAPLITSDLFFGEEYELVVADTSYDEETRNELTKIANEIGFDLELNIDTENNI